MDAKHYEDLQRYSKVAVALHWAIAVCIIFNLSTGFFVKDMPLPLRGWVVWLHLSMGISVLILSVVRIAWRLLKRPPEHVPPLRGWEGALSKFVHGGLYAGMILVPLAGWAIVSAAPPAGSAGAAAALSENAPLYMARSHPVILWGIVEIPRIAAVEKIGATAGGLEPQGLLREQLVAGHEAGAWMLIALLVLHIAGALKHQIVDRRPQFRRIWWS